MKLQGPSDSTIDVYARAVRRLTQHYDCCPDQLTTGQLIGATPQLRYRVFLLATYSMVAIANICDT